MILFLFNIFILLGYAILLLFKNFQGPNIFKKNLITGLLDRAESSSHLPAINNACGSYEPEGLARLGHLGWESDDSGEHEKDSGIL